MTAPPDGFLPGDPHAGYYVDFRDFATTFAPTARAARERLATTPDERANPVSIAQVGLGAWQLARGRPEWAPIVADAAGRLVARMDADGLIPYWFPMTHTFRLAAPWHSAMAQGEAASLFLRAARTLDEPGLESAARRAARPLLDARLGLVAEEPEGPVLQEYPTDPPSHVLNGWIWALWGLYDLGVGLTGSSAEQDAFAAGVQALAARLGLYRAARRWSRYDLYPHPIVNVASPYYHRVHIRQLAALDSLAPNQTFVLIGREWQAGAESLADRGLALARKVAFRVVRPTRPRRQSL